MLQSLIQTYYYSYI